MRARSINRPVTRWLVVIGLQVPTLLVLASCKNDRAESVKTEAQDLQQRAVFGSAPDPVSAKQPQTSKTNPERTIDADKLQERARSMKPVSPKSRANPSEQPSVKDP